MLNSDSAVRNIRIPGLRDRIRLMSDENDPKKPYVKSSIEADELEFLSNAIVEDRAVLYIGSGVSKAANLPTWKELLLRLYNEGAKELLVSDKKSLDYLGEQIKSGNYIEAADLLQHVLDTDLEAVLWNIVQGATEPTAIHVNAARIPFQMALTTNYDLLLELAYSSLAACV